MSRLADPDRMLALAYAPGDRRDALAALFRLDEALGRVVRGARDPLLGQMRLTWWHEALAALDDGPLPADPVLAEQRLSGIVPGVVSGSALAGMVEGWEALLEEPIDLMAFAHYRGSAMFRIAAAILGGDHPAIEDAGAGWALVDLARHSSDPVAAAEAMTAAAPRLHVAMTSVWPPRLRALGALAALARRDVSRGTQSLQPAGHPARMLRALRHRLTGR